MERTEKNPWWRQEDWMAFALGALFLAGVLFTGPVKLPGFKWSDLGTLGGVLGTAPSVVAIAVLYLVTSLPGIALLKGNAARYAAGFPFVFLVAWASQILAGNSGIAYWGVEYVIFALLLGLLISNGPGTPEWLREAVRTEYYIKTGLVIMGATVLFSDIVSAGLLGMLQACLVVSVIWFAAFALAKRFRLDDEFAAILASAVSICGVSAAIATCGAIQGDRRKMSYVASVVLIVAIPMIVLQPWMIRAMSLSDAVGGAWLGGTLDTTGSVVAAGALISETTMKVGTIVKFAQNLLIGFAAFGLAVWWSLKKAGPDANRPGAAVIWERFPKFVLGFVGASLVFSFLVEPAAAKQAGPLLSGLRNWWFAMAFASIGLETKFTDLLSMEGGRPFAAFLIAQGANIVWTLLLAWLIFGGVLFGPVAI
ncbi:MAG TPA: putative sulfate exporter family transporter [Solibacterales bacterium]|nr:putative sulfate exporter family transporter [Bryobacterales bacterium]